MYSRTFPFWIFPKPRAVNMILRPGIFQHVDFVLPDYLSTGADENGITDEPFYINNQGCGRVSPMAFALLAGRYTFFGNGTAPSIRRRAGLDIVAFANTNTSFGRVRCAHLQTINFNRANCFVKMAAGCAAGGLSALTDWDSKTLSLARRF